MGLKCTARGAAVADVIEWEIVCSKETEVGKHLESSGGRAWTVVM